MKPDFAAELAALVRDVAPEALAAAARIEREVRARYGGQQVRIAERPPLTLHAIDERLRQRMPVAAIATDLGVSRRTIYRHLKRPEKRAANT